MNYNQLSDEAKEVLKGMVAFCINRGYKMGMDEGIKEWTQNGNIKSKHDFRQQLENFSKDY